MTKTHKKQKLYTETPEFPSLPFNKTFDDVKDFAKKSQEALKAVKTTFVTNSFISLPLISPHQPQYRFIIENDNSISLIIRNSYHVLKKEIETLNRNKSGIYLRGPVGVGKSYLLYLLAAEYRMNRKHYRVTYINDCSKWRRDKLEYILREFIITFYDDTIDGKSIVDWCQTVTESEKEKKMMKKLIDSLVNYVHEFNLQWIVIFDQHNALYSKSVVVHKFPFNIIDTLSDNRVQNIKVIISASANNEAYPTEMKGWYTHEISSHRFDENEFKVWCDHYELQNIGKVKHDSEEAVDALFWTGGVPFELYSLWIESGENLSAKTKNYRKNRTNEMRESHKKFCKKLSADDIHALSDCVSHMALRLSPPEGLEAMDRQLFDFDLDEDGHEIITALNPVARLALLGRHKKTQLDHLSLVAELILKEKTYPNSMKGKISEMYIATMLELSLLFAFKYRKVADISKIGLSNDSPKSKRIGIKSVVHFLKNKIPPKALFKEKVTTLFVPESPTYPRFDFFLWDSDRKILMGFQVTVINPFYRHSKMENSEIWQEFCFGTSPKMPMELYWVVPKSCLGENANAYLKDDSIILFEDLVSDFPALGKLNLDKDDFS